VINLWLVLVRKRSVVLEYSSVRGGVHHTLVRRRKVALGHVFHIFSVKLCGVENLVFCLLTCNCNLALVPSILQSLRLDVTKGSPLLAKGGRGLSSHTEKEGVARAIHSVISCNKQGLSCPPPNGCRTLLQRKKVKTKTRTKPSVLKGWS
jgi:hypothetical protein